MHFTNKINHKAKTYNLSKNIPFIILACYKIVKPIN